MLRLLNIWRSGSRGVFLFDSILLERIRARCDPDYDGEPADSLPPPRLPPMVANKPSYVPPQPAPPSSSTVYNNASGGFHHPSMPSIVTSASPLLPPMTNLVQPSMTPLAAIPSGSQDLIYVRAAELLKNLFAQMNVPGSQQIPLSEIHRVNPELYQQIMVQAHREVVTSSPILQASSSGTPPSYAATAPSGTLSKPPTPPLASLLLSKLNAQNALDRSSLQYLASVMDDGQGLKRAKKKSGETPTEGSVSARAWFLNENDWRSGVSSTTEVSVKLFQETSNSKNDSLSSAMAQQGIQESSVPKDDSQTRCPLSGEEFETFWSSEEQQWMYKNAIRPDPKGPIYKLHAWLATQRGKTSENLTDGISSMQTRKRVRVE